MADPSSSRPSPPPGQGVLIGTTSYMSPEQARGVEVTRRSDVWAFGAILFEMLTGKRAFTGQTTSDVLAAILQRRSGSERAAGRRRHRRSRGSSGGVSNVIRRLASTTSATRDSTSRMWSGRCATKVRSTRRQWRGAPPRGVLSNGRVLGWAVMLGVVALALSVPPTSSAPAREGARQEVRLQLSPPAGMRFVSVPAVSPDGSQIVFAAVANAGGAARLWLRPFAATVPTELPGTEGASYPFWSADSRFIGFFADGKLKRVAIAGGNPVIVCDAPAGRGGLWLDDDTIVFAPMAISPLVRVNAAGGSPVPFTALADDETGHRFPQRLPGRQLLYFSVNRAPEKSGTRLITIDDPHQAIAYVASQGAAEYVNGFLLFVPAALGGRRCSHSA